MISKWRWALANSIGPSHVKNAQTCQDYAVCEEFETAEGTVLVAIVADGAGAASHAEIGARLVCVGFLRAVKAFFRKGEHCLDDAVESVVSEWIEGIRDRITMFARRQEISTHEYAATLVAVLAGPESALLVHIGDGAIVVHRQDTEDLWVPSWPYHGEYASTTSFITAEPRPRLSIVKISERLDQIAVFSDGLERLVLDFEHQSAHSPFFARMFQPLLNSVTDGHDKLLSNALRDYLDSQIICDRTDDDKCLILGVRM